MTLAREIAEAVWAACVAHYCVFCARGDVVERVTVVGTAGPQWVHRIAPCGASRLHEMRHDILEAPARRLRERRMAKCSSR